jgi:hypothetical protein
LLLYAAFRLQQVGCVAVLWKRSELDGLALLVSQVIPATHEQQGPSDQAEKPDDDLSFPAGDCCSMPPGAAAASLIQEVFALSYPKAPRMVREFLFRVTASNQSQLLER